MTNKNPNGRQPKKIKMEDNQKIKVEDNQKNS